MFPDPCDEFDERERRDERIEACLPERRDIPFGNELADVYADCRADGMTERDAASVADMGCLPFAEWQELYCAA